MGSAARHVMRETLLWATMALAGFALFFFFDDLMTGLGLGNIAAPSPATRSENAARSSGFAREVRLKADSRGHFLIEAAINGRPATFIADTGATVVVLSYDEAARLGLSPQHLRFNARVQTANGVASAAPVTLDRVSVDEITVRNVDALVAGKGALETNLLGMSFLGRLDRVQMEGSELILAH
jgi:aspartyl protease family protein